MSRFTILLGLFWIALAITIFISQYLIPPKIEVQWETESEFDTVGFNVLRSEAASGNFVRINEIIIPGSVDATLGGSYQFVDTNVEPGTVYYYRLEDIEYDNTTKLHQIIEASSEKQPWWIAGLALLSAFVGIAIIIMAGLSRRGKLQ